MPDKFDPYYRWLGIPPKEQPPNHYRLLGIELFESDPQLIDSFSLRHTDFLREITDGPHVPDAQRLLNELAAARRCLLDPQRKAAYDAELRERLAAVDKPAAHADPALRRSLGGVHGHFRLWLVDVGLVARPAGGRRGEKRRNCKMCDRQVQKRHEKARRLVYKV